VVRLNCLPPLTGRTAYTQTSGVLPSPRHRDTAEAARLSAETTVDRHRLSGRRRVDLRATEVLVPYWQKSGSRTRVR